MKKKIRFKLFWINNHKGFTLMETLIVVVILWIFSVVLIRAYITISQIWLRIQQESHVTQEILTLSEILQNLSEKNSIDYKRYAKEYWTWYLSNHQWFVDKLFLTGQDWVLSIYTTWFGCLLSPWDEFNLSGDIKSITRNCWLELNKNWETIKLINSQKVYLSKSVFKIIPFASQDQFLNDGEVFSTTLCKFKNKENTYTNSNYLACLHKPWFWLIMKAYTSSYNKNRSNNIYFNIQQFFN